MFSRRRIPTEPKPFKIMLVGDSMVGKSSICKSYTKKSPFLTYHPTISETHEIMISIQKKNYSAILWDTAGVEEWDRLRVNDYYSADCFILCYAINNPVSFMNIESKWLPELQRYCPDVPIFLVGTKNDVRTSTNRWISDSEGRHLKLKIKAVGYAECSAKSIASIEGVFIQSIIIAEKYRNLRRNTIRCKKCTIL